MASDECSLLDADSQQHRFFQPILKPLIRASSADNLDNQNSLHQIGLSDQTSTQPPGWVSEPRELRKSRKSLLSDMVFNVSMVLLSLPFLVLAFKVASLHGQPVTPSQTNTMAQLTRTVYCTFPPFVVGMLMFSRHQPYSQSFSRRLLGKQRRNTLHGNWNKVVHWVI